MNNANKTQFIKLEEIFNIRTGSTPSKQNDKNWINGEIPWFTVDDINNSGDILYKSKKHITLNSIKCRVADKNSIIVGTTATIGIHALIKVDSYTNQQFTILTLKNSYKQKYDINFLNYYFFILDKYCIQHSHKTTTGFLSINKNILKKFIIPLISIKTQRHIVNIIIHLFLFLRFL